MNNMSLILLVTKSISITCQTMNSMKKQSFISISLLILFLKADNDLNESNNAFIVNKQLTWNKEDHQ